MAKRKKSLKKDTSFRTILSRLLPESVQSYIARRVYDLWALSLMGLGVFIMGAIITYSANDPSLNTAAPDSDIQNIFGYGGAIIADIFVQSFGLAALVSGIAFGYWGINLLRRQGRPRLGVRFLWLLGTMCFLSVTFARIPSRILANENFIEGTYLGGVVGSLILNTVGQPLGSLLGGWEYTTLAVLSGLIGFYCLLKALDIPLLTVKNQVASALRFSVFTLKLTINAIRAFASWVRHYNDPEYASDNLRAFFQPIREQIAEKLQKEPETPGKLPKAPEKSDSEDDSQPPKKDKNQSAIQVVKPKSSTQNSSRQGSFPLEDKNTDWELPPVDFLTKPDARNVAVKPDDAGLRRNAQMLQSVLADFNVSGEIVKIHPGPVVTLYEFEPAPGVKSSRVINLSDDIARSMAALSVRVAVIPGRNVIGIELPNETRQTVYLRELLDTRDYEDHKAKLPLVLGKDIGGQPVITDLTRMPHLLVAGTTGSGKSVAVNTMLMSLLYRLSPEQCRMIMIDPKMLELSVYDDIPHLLSPVVTEPGKAVVALKWTVQEMENRYRAMSKLGVRNIEGYNARLAEARKKGETLVRKVQTGYDPETGNPTFEDQPMDLTSLPYIVVVVDEFADLMLVAGKDVENAIQRLAQMARAAGIHLIMATQRPSVDVITGVVKANFPTRISFHVTSKIDSRTIIGEGGAEQLLGMGDMLYMMPGGRLTRVHGPFVADQEVEDVVSFLKSQGEPSYLEDITDGEEGFGDGSDVMGALFGEGGKANNDDKVDDLYDQAVAIVAKERKASTSFIQRHLQIGYNRAARIVEEMESQGVIGPANHVGKREVLVSDYSDA